jgi:hypothetical protein
MSPIFSHPTNAPAANVRPNAIVFILCLSIMSSYSPPIIDVRGIIPYDLSNSAKSSTNLHMGVANAPLCNGRDGAVCGGSHRAPGDFVGGEMAESEGQEEPKAPCKVCGSPMILGASLCPTCKFFQNPVRRQFQFFSSIASIVTFFVALASLLAWLFSTVPNLLRTFFPQHHLSVVSANSFGSIIVFNDGDRDLFVSHVLLYMTGRTAQWRAPYLPIQAGVPTGQFARHEFPKPHDFPDGEFVRGVQEPQWKQLLSRAVANPQCFNLYFLAQNDPFYRMISQAAGPSLNTFPVTANVEYLVPGSSTPHLAEFPAVGIMHRDLSSACQ